ncbi:methyltransferase domain-containing protein [Methylomonas methanica]|uniref:Methyltransferase type 12 n=1 Tax=Methylomonas methanica (strain DSM 25384 / MC09) TaxID=857087 RepID=F9ZWC3_METMM|nr:methyltransferase domain-containing protein [Methylomonas methanica]AEF99592.1 Methyltransferase type 12 [Methylomonas methanica MC09]
MSKATNVGEGISVANASWTFGEDTPKKFTEHVRRSVPFYEEGHELVQQVSDFFVQPDSVCYELGVSTGVLIRKLAARHKPSVRWVGIDKEPNMIEQARLEIQNSGFKAENVELLADDINLFPYEPADFIVAYYTVQFIPPRLRQELLNRIYQSLNWGGGFVLFEKVRGPDARFQDIVSSLYAEYKLVQGYSPEEVIAKSRSLKGVLEPFSTQGNIDMIKRAGFLDVSTIFKWVCFEGFLCIK